MKLKCNSKMLQGMDLALTKKVFLFKIHTQLYIKCIM